jgi:ADP-heptose:LPS heptosyltransferase
MKGRSWVRGTPLRSGDFPAGTPLNRFFAWNERAWHRDRRYTVACDLYRLITALGDTGAARALAVAHLVRRPVVIARRRQRVRVAQAASLDGPDVAASAIAAARRTVDRLTAAVGSADIAAHAAVFVAFEQLAAEIDLDALARRRPRIRPAERRPSPRRILVIRLSALGDFVQALGPVAAIRRHHRGDRMTLLTTSAFAEFAGRLGFFDEVMIDRRPAPLDIPGWLALRRRLRRARFDRVYDLQTSERSAVYARLFRPGPVPEWSGAARRCSHPHANLDRDRQHTIDKQAEQLLMAGIYPTPLPLLPAVDRDLPRSLAGRRFVLLVPGSSPRHPAKRWPTRRFAPLARALSHAGYVPVVIGSSAERHLGDEIAAQCPEVVDLIGETDIDTVAALAQQAALTVGNDTGVTHLAAAAGSPIVVLFSAASDPAWCAPRGRTVRVLAAPDLGELTVDRVFAEAVAAIGRHGPPGAAGDIAPVVAGRAGATGVGT